jgi:hypothetical protein
LKYIRYTVAKVQIQLITILGVGHVKKMKKKESGDCGAARDEHNPRDVAACADESIVGTEQISARATGHMA